MAILIIIFSLSYCFILPFQSLHDPSQVRAHHEQAYAIASQETEGLLRFGDKTSNRIGELLLLMILSSTLTFWLPGMAPFLCSGVNLVWFNNMFLVVPTLGAFLSGIVQVYRRHRVIPWSLFSIQLVLFLYIVLMAAKSTHPIVYVSEWLIFTLCFLFIVLGGYNSTMVYMLLRSEMDYKLVQRTQRWAGFAFQVGGTIGITLNIIFVHGNLYWENDIHHGRHHHAPASPSVGP